MIKVLIADDHVMFREGIRQILKLDSRFQLVAEASTARELLELARRHDPDVVLLDISMPGRGGLEGLADLKSWNPRIKVLMLTAHPEDQYAVRCLKAGADGYLTKDSASSDLLEAILRVSCGRKYVTPLLAETLAAALAGDGAEKPHERLSDRELQVMERLGAGKTLTEIGKELCLSVKTVSTYRSRIVEKMHLRTTADIIRYVLTEKLVD